MTFGREQYTRITKPMAMLEAQFKNQVIEIAKRYGWLVHHDLPAMNQRGKWATHIQGFSCFPKKTL